MPKYMINIFYGEGGGETDGPAMMRKYQEWSEKIGDRILFAHKLKDAEGRVLRKQSGKVVDGPYAESKESIGGFYLVECENYGVAVALASGCPSLHYQGSTVEVREVEI